MPKDDQERRAVVARAGLIVGLFAVALLGCSDDERKDPAVTSDDMTTEEWCAVYAERLPPLRDPAPADDELAGLLDQYVDRAERLAGGADGISDEGQAATETVATYFRELRDGVDAGGDLESLIDDEAFFSGPLFEAGTQIDAEAARLCSGDA